MLTDFGYIGLFLIVALLFTVSTILIPATLRLFKIVPHKPNASKYAPFECGMETIGKTWVQFNFRYYSYALVFLVVDVLVLFLYPWAAMLRSLGPSSLVAVIVLISIVLVGYVYAWRKKALEWK